MRTVLLIIEDERLLAAELERRFVGQGYDVRLAHDIETAEQILETELGAPLVVLSDMSLPDGNALDLLDRRRAHGVGQEWIFLTGYGTIGESVRGLRLGAFDFLEKPADPDRLDLAVQGAARSTRAQQRVLAQSERDDGRFQPRHFLGSSAVARQTREMLGRLAAVPFTAVLLTGATGTGKGLAARILHHSGTRGGGPIVEINCAALPRDLLESELFGHESGAFTGARGQRRGLIEQADGGTLFLDEIGEMPLELQSKVLKVLEDRRVRRLGGSREIEVDLRLVAASNRDLPLMVERGEFRPDLYHRLNTFVLPLPALTSRLDDLRDLVPPFVEEFAALVGRPPPAVDEAMWARLRAHDWPGNIRELRNVIERCVLLGQGPVLEEDLFPGDPRGTKREPPSGDSVARVEFVLDGSLSLEQMEAELVRSALLASGGNLQSAARLLRTTRETLRYRIQKYELSASGNTD
ncbi:MAG: sigma-54-dependent Fis family transcriptional regulator [Pseudomonadota bacterium]|nr:sigma-54-dependent Fis family transcriptional regulator [Pseudomonadota bacterium]